MSGEGVPSTPLHLLRYRCLEKAYRLTPLHSLRYRCLEKAYRLALDLRDHDLFMDLHRAALRHGQRHLAAAALAKADQLDEDASITSGTFVGGGVMCGVNAFCRRWVRYLCRDVWLSWK